MKALVTGGGGFLGRRIVEMLLDRGARVRVLGHQPHPDLVARGVECQLGDIRDARAVEPACAGIDTVFHVAGMTGPWGAKRDFFAVNAGGTAHVVEACLRNAVTRLIYTGSPSVVLQDGVDVENGTEDLPCRHHHSAPYPASKAEAECCALAAAGREYTATPDGPQKAGSGRLAVCALRPHLIWGPGDRHLVPRILDLARRGRLRRVGNGQNRVSLTYVDNAAHAHLLAADRLHSGSPLDGQAYFICDGEPVLLWPWIDRLLRELGLPPAQKTLSAGAARRLGRFCELVRPLPLWPGQPWLTRFIAGQLACSHYFDCSKARRDFDYVPLVDNETGMQRLLAWLRENPQP